MLIAVFNYRSREQEAALKETNRDAPWPLAGRLGIEPRPKPESQQGVCVVDRYRTGQHDLCLLVATRISSAFDRLDQTPVLNAFTISRSVKEVQARGVRNAVPSLVSSSGIPISPIRRNLFASSDDERNAQTH